MYTVNGAVRQIMGMGRVEQKCLFLTPPAVHLLDRNNRSMCDTWMRSRELAEAQLFRLTDNTFGVHEEAHDVHLIRLDGGTTYDEVNEWINWLDVGTDGYYADNGALTSTHGEPGPVTFLGGVQDIAPSSAHPTAYFEVSLSPGDYAWVAEVPDADGENMLNRFTVTPPGHS